MRPPWAAVKAGVPYIATGTSPLKYIQENLITDLEYASLGMEALHTVEYPTASLITASQVKDADNVIYTYNCGVITSVPEGAPGAHQGCRSGRLPCRLLPQ